MLLENMVHSVVFLEDNNEAIKLDFDYLNYKKDKHPVIFYMGDWVHPVTGNKLFGGINLNYLEPVEIQYLKKIVKTYNVLKGGNLKDRYWKLYHGIRKLLGYKGLVDPQEFMNRAYRTYNEKFISGRRRGNIVLLDFTAEDEQDAVKRATEDGEAWDELEPEEQAKYIDQVLQAQEDESDAAEKLTQIKPAPKQPPLPKATQFKPMTQQDLLPPIQPQPQPKPPGNPIEKDKIDRGLNPDET